MTNNTKTFRYDEVVSVECCLVESIEQYRRFIADMKLIHGHADRNNAVYESAIARYKCLLEEFSLMYPDQPRDWGPQ